MKTQNRRKSVTQDAKGKSQQVVSPRGEFLSFICNFLVLHVLFLCVGNDFLSFLVIHFVPGLVFTVVKIKFEPRVKQAVKWVHLIIERLIPFPLRISSLSSLPIQSIYLRNQQWIKITHLCQFHLSKRKTNYSYSYKKFSADSKTITF